MKVSKSISAFAAAMVLAGASTAHASVYITEWMYAGLASGGEFIQFTNTGAAPVDMTNWTFGDSTHSTGPGPESLSGFGTIQPNESVILTELSPAAFQTDWNLDPSVKIVGGNTTNIGRSDQINLFDSTGALEDQLTYNDQGTGTVKGPRTNGIAAYILPANDGQNNASLAVKATASDSFGSRTSAQGELGNPGPVATPEPASLGLLGGAVALLMGRRRRSR